MGGKILASQREDEGLSSVDIPFSPEHSQEFGRYLLGILVVRAAVLLVGLNLADSLGILPYFLGPFAFLPLFNNLAITLTLVYLALWWISEQKVIQLYIQIAIDLALVTILVASTRGIDSPFVSFYLLIIMYCSLALGRNGGVVGAALSTMLYAGIIAAEHLNILVLNNSHMDSDQATFRISAHVLGFIAVALLGAYLHQRLQVVERELEKKIDSLKQLQQLNEHIVSSIRSGLITTDLQGRIAVFNSTAEELTEKYKSEMLGKPVQLIIGESFWGEILDTDFFMSARALRHEEWITLQSGTSRYLGFSISPLTDQQKQLLGYIISFQDLTEIKRLEEEVRLKDRMAAIGRMAAGIAHEIRNPLTAMRGSVEILRSHADLPMDDERLLDILTRESDRLNKFVEDFLHFARPGKYVKCPIDLVPLLRDSVMLLRNSSDVRERHSVILNLEDPTIPVMGNADQLQQVFWNLAQNAVRAMPNGGELIIGAGKSPEGGGRVIFQDEGVGMDQEDKDQLFQPFHSGFKGGSGLGLSITFQIIEDHQGKILFESARGKGTKVSLYFPPENQAGAIHTIQ